MDTFHTNVFVFPLLRISLWQRFGLSDRDHIFIPSAKYKVVKKSPMLSGTVVMWGIDTASDGDVSSVE